MVMVIQYHCSQTFSTHLGGGEGCSPVRRGFGAQPQDLFFRGFLSTFGDNFLVFKDQIKGRERKKEGRRKERKRDRRYSE